VRRRNPVRSPSRQFIESVLATEITRLHVVYSEGRPAAGLITLESRDQTVYYLGASDPEFSEHRPADFGLSEVVREAIRDGRRTLNLGASGSSQSLRRFKEKFGAIEHQYFSYFAPDLWLQIGKTLRYYRWRVKQSWTGQSTVSP
jgi:lipid II:glycine glycyltransferase (peptidoglycan interpeptide bridge formation enzyme)